MLPTWHTLSEDEMVDWWLDAESRQISLEAGSVTGAVLPPFCLAIILGVWYCGLNNGSLECAFNLLSEISTVGRVVCKFHCKTHGEKQGHNLTVWRTEQNCFWLLWQCFWTLSTNDGSSVFGRACPSSWLKELLCGFPCCTTTFGYRAVPSLMIFCNSFNSIGWSYLWNFIDCAIKTELHLVTAPRGLKPGYWLPRNNCPNSTVAMAGMLARPLFPSQQQCLSQR